MDEQGKENEYAGTSSCAEEMVRAVRIKKKQMDPYYCPVCSITIRSSEFEAHLFSEIERLCKLSGTKQKLVMRNGSSGESHSDMWDTYQKVKSNRNGRQKSKTRKRKLEESICPVCHKEVSEDLNTHVNFCLSRNENGSADSDENIDVEGDGEEYEWAGQSRVRVTTLFQGASSNIGTSLTVTNEDEDLVVDDDDTNLFGPSQYSEGDMIFTGNDKESHALRKAVTGLDPIASASSSDEVQGASNENSDFKGDYTLEALKNRIRELERYETKDDIYKCLICMERYKTPVISVCCWHVHCEQCWLQTLGSKKLCPQCNMITSPSDLRRIYM